MTEITLLGIFLLIVDQKSIPAIFKKLFLKREIAEHGSGKRTRILFLIEYIFNRRLIHCEVKNIL